MAGKFKIGEVVRVKRGAFKSEFHRIEYRKNYTNVIGLITKYYNNNDAKENNGDYILDNNSTFKIYFSDEDLIKATRNEAFLYYTHGNYVLRSKE